MYSAHTVHTVHTVATLLYDGVNPFELGVATEVFGVERPELGVPWYRFLLCAAAPGPVRTSIGFDVVAPADFSRVAEADTVIVPGPRPALAAYPDALLETLREAYEHGARLIALCTGTFLLAAAGLLDGRRVTTHWNLAADLAARYSRLQVDPSILYLEDGQIFTSAGTAASIDLCLHVVRRDYGAGIAAALARRMVVPPHRDGGQAQYIETPLPAFERTEPFGATLIWLAAHLQEALTIEQMAARAIMSPRTFARRFQATLGTTPYHWLLQQRITLAQRFLETTDDSIEQIAVACGFRSAATLRLHFQRLLHTAPQAYRRAFHHERTEGQPVRVPERAAR